MNWGQLEQFFYAAMFFKKGVDFPADPNQCEDEHEDEESERKEDDAEACDRLFCEDDAPDADEVFFRIGCAWYDTEREITESSSFADDRNVIVIESGNASGDESFEFCCEVGVRVVEDAVVFHVDRGSDFLLFLCWIEGIFFGEGDLHFGVQDTVDFTDCAGDLFCEACLVADFLLHFGRDESCAGEDVKQVLASSSWESGLVEVRHGIKGLCAIDADIPEDDFGSAACCCGALYFESVDSFIGEEDQDFVCFSFIEAIDDDFSRFAACQ